MSNSDGQTEAISGMEHFLPKTAFMAKETRTLPQHALVLTGHRCVWEQAGLKAQRGSAGSRLPFHSTALDKCHVTGKSVGWHLQSGIQLLLTSAPCSPIKMRLDADNVPAGNLADSVALARMISPCSRSCATASFLAEVLSISQQTLGEGC